MGDYKWFPLNSGGGFRKWFGNNSKIVNLQYDGAEIKRNVKNYRLREKSYYFKEGITWGRITSAEITFREAAPGTLFGDAGPIGFINNGRHYLLGFLSSNVVKALLQFTNPTLNFQVHDIMDLPLIVNKQQEETVSKTVMSNIEMSKIDWDSFETSWDFQRHPLIRSTQTIKEAFTQWERGCTTRFNQLKANEEELNRIFIDIYGLQDELTPEEDDKDVTVRRADLGRDIRSFVSYAVGCMMGRYSLDVDGLAYAGGDWDSSKYKTFIPDKDAIIPITDDEYFKDDIVGRFVDFVRTVYGTDTLEENLKFIADALGEKGSTSREVIRNYFLNDFYRDHCKTYQKRPIYWLFDSGKKNGFKCLIYMHRYQPDTIARIRTDYVHEQQARYRTAISGLERQINGASTSERVRLNKQLEKLKDQAEETRLYEEKIHHLADQMIPIDLDDGVKHNYAIFQDVLAKIK
uniref:BREX-1 system adenine-specific DNA-methyltransferase PglX n=1 Tax=Candidatus Cryptobacteroides bacterium TaxID=3085639 RepID=UPI003FEFC0B3